MNEGGWCAYCCDVRVNELFGSASCIQGFRCRIGESPDSFYPLLYLFSFWIIFENSFAVVSFVVRRHTPAELNAALSLYNNSFLKKT